jgi:hypothetical protein
MKLTITMALLAGMAWANATLPGRTVTVCSRKNADILTLGRAQAQVSKMFATAGIKIEWHEPRLCPAGAIQISLDEDAPATEHPGALAYALPYEGTHIVLFYGRILKHCIAADDPNLPPILLAHVMVHEITHILQGTNWHSDTGIMKAHWAALDFSQMRFRPLPFTPMDVYLIQHGLDGRSRNAALAAGSLTPDSAE